jgi:hypothetical protein
MIRDIHYFKNDARLPLVTETTCFHHFPARMIPFPSAEARACLKIVGNPFSVGSRPEDNGRFTGRRSSLIAPNLSDIP